MRPTPGARTAGAATGSRGLPLTIVLASASALLGCGSTFPDWDRLPQERGTNRNPRGMMLLQESIEAHGGDLFEEVRDLAASFSGTWSQVGSRVQAKLADRSYRDSSEERYLLRTRVVAQQHAGPDGTKYVLRLPSEIEVLYDGEASDDAERLRAAALVADAYEMLLLSPSYFKHRADVVRRVDRYRYQGELYDRLIARLRPGLGYSEEDEVMLWIHARTHRLRRLQFTVNGFDSVRVDQVDVAFDSHRWLYGKLWPVEFVERIQKPVRLFARRWYLTGLDLNRGLSPDDLTPTGLQGLASEPARSIEGEG